MFRRFAALGLNRLSQTGKGAPNRRIRVPEFRESIEQERLQVRCDHGCRRHEAGSLVQKGRQNQEYRDAEREDGQERDDASGNRPRASQSFQPVRERIKAVSDGRADDERQDDVAEKPHDSQKDRHGDAPGR